MEEILIHGTVGTVKNHVCQSYQVSSGSSQAGVLKSTLTGIIHSLASLAKPASHRWFGVSYSLLDHPAEDSVLRYYFNFSLIVRSAWTTTHINEEKHPRIKFLELIKLHSTGELK